MRSTGSTNGVVTALAAALLIGSVTVAPARSQTTALPPLSQPQPLRLPRVVQETLPNGMRLVVLEDHDQPALWLRLALPAGSIRDPRDKVGLAAMTANLLTQGTASRTEAQIADLVDGMGASLGAAADDDFMYISASGLSGYTDTLFALLGDVTLRPTFPEAEANRYKTRTLSQITQSLADGGTVASAALARAVYGEHPYGNFSEGTAKTLPGLTPADLKQFHQTYFAPNAATLFVVGDIKPEQARKKALEVFGQWQKKDIPALPPPPKKTAGESGSPDKPSILVIDRPGAEQTEIRIGQLTAGYSDPNRIPAQVAATVLGGGPFGNRLTQEIRVKRGLTYGVGSGIARNLQAGQFLISTFTKNQTTGEVVRLALEEVRKLQQVPPPPAELDARKNYLTGTFAISVATPAGLLERLSTAILYGTGPEELSRYTEKVMAVKPEEVQKVLQNLPLAQDSVVLVGNAGEVKPQVEEVGPVTVIQQEQLDLLSPTLRSAATGPSNSPAPTVPASPEAMAAGKMLLDSMVKAHGGPAFLALKAVTFKGKGKLTTPPAQGSLEVPIDEATVTTALPGRIRFDLKTGFGEITIGSAGGGAPTWILFSGQVQEQPNPDETGASDPITLVLKAVNEKWPVAALAETAESSDGKALKGFTVTNEKGKTAKIFVEPESSLVRRVEFASGNNTVVFLLGDYKAVNNVPMPASFRQLVNGQEQFNLTFDSFDLAPSVSDAQFEKPKL